MLSRYFRFYDGRRNKDSLIWWLGTTMHIALWQKLHAADPDSFELVRSAGSAHYDVKKKKLLTYDFSTSLNLVGNAEDGEELSEQLLTNKTIEALFARSLTTKTDAYACDLVVFEADYLDTINSCLSEMRNVSLLDITYRKHDSAKPFLVETGCIPERGWLEYAVKQMS